ncbi:MAG: acyl-CoA dehydrogenase family protein [Streptosporangiaceae bacterium]
MRRDLYEPDHEAFREVVQAYVKREVTPNQQRWEQEHIVDPQAWLAAGKYYSRDFRRVAALPLSVMCCPPAWLHCVTFFLAAAGYSSFRVSRWPGARCRDAAAGVTAATRVIRL